LCEEVDEDLLAELEEVEVVEVFDLWCLFLWCFCECVVEVALDDVEECVVDVALDVVDECFVDVDECDVDFGLLDVDDFRWWKISWITSWNTPCLSDLITGQSLDPDERL